MTSALAVSYSITSAIRNGRFWNLAAATKPGGRPRNVNLRMILDGIVYLLGSGCQWRLLVAVIVASCECARL